MNYLPLLPQSIKNLCLQVLTKTPRESLGARGGIRWLFQDMHALAFPIFIGSFMSQIWGNIQAALKRSLTLAVWMVISKALVGWSVPVSCFYCLHCPCWVLWGSPWHTQSHFQMESQEAFDLYFRLLVVQKLCRTQVQVLSVAPMAPGIYIQFS